MMAEYSRLLASLDGGNKYTNNDTTTEQKPNPEPSQESEPPTAKNTTEDAPDLVALAAKLQEAKNAVVFCLNNPTGSVNFHGLEYWAGEVERLRKEILKAA